MERAQYELEIPFSSRELADLAERARLAIVDFERQTEQADANGNEVSRDADLSAASAFETLAALACLAGMSLDTRFMSSLARWPQWNPTDSEYSNTAQADFFSGLSQVLSALPDEQLQQTARHRLPRVRVALAEALDPTKSAADRSLLEQLFRDSQHEVSRAASSRLGKLSPPWFSWVFDQDPSQLLAESERERCGPALEALAKAFQLAAYKHTERSALLLEALPRLPDALALPLLERLMQQAGSPFPELLVKDLLRRGDAAAHLARASIGLIDNTRYSMYASPRISEWLELAPPELRGQVCLLLLDAVRDAPPETAQARCDGLPEIIAKHWPPALDPTPLWQTWRQHAPTGAWSRLDELLKPLIDSERLDLLREPLFEHLRRAGPEPRTQACLRRLLEDLTETAQQELFAEGLASDVPGFTCWTMQQQAQRLKQGPPEACRALIQKWLADERLAGLIRDSEELRLLALPELRLQLTQGKLELRVASLVMQDLHSLYGGMAAGGVLKRPDDPVRRAERSAELGAYLSPSAGPASEHEWSIFRGLQRHAFEQGETHMPCLMAEGPWHPEDRRLLLQLAQCLEPLAQDADSEQATLDVMLVFDWIATKPEPSLLPQLKSAYHVAQRSERLTYWKDQVEQLMVELGDSSAAPESSGPVRSLELDWMDRDEDEDQDQGERR